MRAGEHDSNPVSSSRRQRPSTVTIPLDSPREGVNPRISSGIKSIQSIRMTPRNSAAATRKWYGEQVEAARPLEPPAYNLGEFVRPPSRGEGERPSTFSSKSNPFLDPLPRSPVPPSSGSASQLQFAASSGPRWCEVIDISASSHVRAASACVRTSQHMDRRHTFQLGDQLETSRSRLPSAKSPSCRRTLPEPDPNPKTPKSKQQRVKSAHTFGERDERPSMGASSTRTCTTRPRTSTTGGVRHANKFTHKTWTEMARPSTAPSHFTSTEATHFTNAISAARSRLSLEFGEHERLCSRRSLLEKNRPAESNGTIEPALRRTMGDETMGKIVGRSNSLRSSDENFRTSEEKPRSGNLRRGGHMQVASAGDEGGADTVQQTPPGDTASMSDTTSEISEDVFNDIDQQAKGPVLPRVAPVLGTNKTYKQQHAHRRALSARRVKYGESVRGKGCDISTTHIRCPNRLVSFKEVYNLKSYFNQLIGKSTRERVTFREIQEKMLRMYSEGNATNKDSLTSGLCGALNVKGLSEEAIREGLDFKDLLLLVYPLVGEKAIEDMMELVRPPPAAVYKKSISKEEKEEFHAMWSVWDADNSGFLDANEFYNVMKDLDQEGFMLENSDHIILFQQINKDGSGVVSLPDFKRWYFRDENDPTVYMWHPEMDKEEQEQAREEVFRERNRSRLKTAGQKSSKSFSSKLQLVYPNSLSGFLITGSSTPRKVDAFSRSTRNLLQAGKHEANSTAYSTPNRNTAAFSGGDRRYTADSSKREESPGINDEFIPARRSANPGRRVSISGEAPIGLLDA
mmetsp:Transcript_9545/g.16409  ORF Transcript_9545/g.16409 Transcript_9545/m.16409 type:complete len:799 (+) Transcript_9545:414-2810(+)